MIKLATVMNVGAGREDPDADFSKVTRFISRNTEQEQKARLSRIIKNA